MKKLILMTLILSASLISASADETAGLGQKDDVKCVTQDQSNRSAKADTQNSTSPEQKPEVKVGDKQG